MIAPKLSKKLIVFMCFAACAGHAMFSGAFFQKVSDDGEDKWTLESNTGMFTREFHFCSMAKSCHFVALDTKDGNFYKSAKREDLENIATNLQTWEKVKSNDNSEKESPIYKQGCKDAMQKGQHENGPIQLSVNGSTIRVLCNMLTDGGGWVVFQRHINNSVNFNRNWTEYENGFGNLTSNFWLGLRALHLLTSEGNHTLRIDLQDTLGDQGYAKYTNFSIGSAEEKYKIAYDKYSGNIGDAMELSKGMPFSTPDRDHDSLSTTNCASRFKSGWWHKRCFHANLNSLVPGNTTSTSDLPMLMSWLTWKNTFGGIKFSEMKVRKES